MKIASVTLKSSEKFAGDLNGLAMKTFKTGERDEVHLEAQLGLVIVLRKGATMALTFPVSQIEKLEMTAQDAMTLLTESRPPKRAA